MAKAKELHYLGRSTHCHGKKNIHLNQSNLRHTHVQQRICMCCKWPALFWFMIIWLQLLSTRALWRRNSPQPARPDNGQPSIWRWNLIVIDAQIWPKNKILSHSRRTQLRTSIGVQDGWITAQFSARLIGHERHLFLQIKLTEINYSFRMLFELFGCRPRGDQTHINESTHLDHLAAILSFVSLDPLSETRKLIRVGFKSLSVYMDSNYCETLLLELISIGCYKFTFIIRQTTVQTKWIDFDPVLPQLWSWIGAHGLERA